MSEDTFTNDTPLNLGSDDLNDILSSFPPSNEAESETADAAKVVGADVIPANEETGVANDDRDADKAAELVNDDSASEEAEDEAAVVEDDRYASLLGVDADDDDADDDDEDDEVDVDEDDDGESESLSFMQNRELSWLTFNERVLDQGADESVPLLERLNFISIFWSNLQEFFMVRVGSLTDLSFIDPPVIDSKTGMTPDDQIKAIHERCHELYPIQESTYEHVRGQLAKEGVRHLRPDDLAEEQRNYLFGLRRSERSGAQESQEEKEGQGQEGQRRRRRCRPRPYTASPPVRTRYQVAWPRIPVHLARACHRDVRPRDLQHVQDQAHQRHLRYAQCRH